MIFIDMLKENPLMEYGTRFRVVDDDLRKEMGKTRYHYSKIGHFQNLSKSFYVYFFKLLCRMVAGPFEAIFKVCNFRTPSE